MRFAFLILAFVVLAVPACRADPPKIDTLTIIKADGTSHVFNIEVADSTERRTIGLMFRKQMDKDAGMLFVFDEQYERPRAFWMKNTLIPLDMLFIHKDGRIGHIHANAVPHDESLVHSNGPTFSVLEINGGRASALGLRPGDMVHQATFGNTLAEKPAIH